VTAGPILSLQDLEKRFPNGKGVGPLDLELGAGIHGLLGPNGSGKTTLLKTLLGFLTPTRGAAMVLGRDVRSDALGVRRLVGYMPENDVLVPGLSAAQTVRLAAELCGLPPGRAHEAASEALHAVGLGEEALHAPNRLSTGQRQRMKLASALVHAPRLLFLDEPTNGLDPKGRRMMLRLIDEVSREKGISVILSTHILPDVEAVCQDAVVLRDGRMVAREDVRARTVQRQAQDTWFDVAALGGLEPFLEACRNDGLVVRQLRAGAQVAAPDPMRLFALARKSGAVLYRAMPGTEGVEDAVLAHLEGGAA